MKYYEGEKLDLVGKEFIVYSKANRIGKSYYYLMSSYNPVEMAIGKGSFNKPLEIVRNEREMNKASKIFAKKYL